MAAAPARRVPGAPYERLLIVRGCRASVSQRAKAAYGDMLPYAAAVTAACGILGHLGGPARIITGFAARLSKNGR